MLESKKIYLLGYSGHALVVIDVALCNNFTIGGYFDRVEFNKNPHNLEYFGSEILIDVKSIVNSDFIFPAIGDNRIRKKVISYIEKNQLNQVKLVHTNAFVSSFSTVDLSTIIAPNVTVNSLAKIGKGCIINSGAIIEHECEIGDFSHVAPGCVLAGSVTVGKEVFIGMNASIKQGVKIGDNVIIGAGAVVINNIPNGETWVGNPARKIK